MWMKQALSRRAGGAGKGQLNTAPCGGAKAFMGRQGCDRDDSGYAHQARDFLLQSLAASQHGNHWV